MENCCDPGKIDGGEINNSIINNPAINTPNINGTVSLDDAAINSIVSQLCTPFKVCIKGHIDGGTFANVTLNNSTLVDTSITRPSINGQIVFDTTAVDSVLNAVKTPITEIIDNKISALSITALGGIADTNGTGSNTTLVNPTLSGEVKLSGEIIATQTAKESLCDVLSPCITEAATVAASALVTNLIADLPPSSVVNAFGVDVVQKALILNTTLQSGGASTPQDWKVSLSDLGAGALTINVDGTTITGNGTTAEPLKLNITEQANPAPTLGVELPTSIIGGRTLILGTPDKMLKLGNWLIPVYAA